MELSFNAGEIRFQYGWNPVPVRMEPSSSTDGTQFQYGWNPIPVRVEPNLSADVMEPFADVYILFG